MASPLQRLGAAALVALIVVGAFVGISQSGVGPERPGKSVLGAGETKALFRAIPQHGVTLGNPHAPVILTEFADLQCPFCRQYAEAVLPNLVDRFVRTGRLKLVFRNLAFIGADSGRAARIAGAAALQNRLWQFTDLMYRNQGQENTGYATDDYLRRIARAAGVDSVRAFREQTSPAVDDQLAAAGREASRYGVDSTPAFLLRHGHAHPTRLSPSALTVPEFTARIEDALGGG